jgi:hypothetical protein
MTVGNSSEGVHSIVLDTGNSVVGVRDIMTNARSGCICGCRECRLGAGKLLVNNGHYKSDRTYVQDLKDILEIQPPGGDRLLIFLRVETPKGHIPFTPLDQLLLDIFHCPAIKNISY